ncbi:MAG TPA: hypothetical protein VEC38_03590 [Candidatus Binataceae bacterium]|nr:hypothetical protein [Candidatus Binataceae bacterium]
MTRPELPCASTFALALALAALVAGCAAPLPTTELPPTRVVANAPEFPDLRDYRGVIDCRFAASGLDQVKIAELARNAQMDFIVPGDRVKPGQSDFGVGGYTSEVLFIPGGSFEAGGGEIVAVNLHAPIDPGKSASDLIGAIHEQGALAIALGPANFRTPDDYALADAIGIYSQQQVWAEQSPRALFLRAIFFSADRFLGAIDQRPDRNLAAYDRLAAGARVTLLAGMGGAENMAVMGSRVGTFEQLFLFYSTHLIAAERTADALIDAIKHGHAYVSFDLMGYVNQFAFYAQTGSAKTMMGDEVQLAPGLALKAELPAAADRIALVLNGSEIASATNASTLEFAPTSAGAYRIEAFRSGRPWIFSNPVYVR